LHPTVHEARNSAIRVCEIDSCPTRFMAEPALSDDVGASLSALEADPLRKILSQLHSFPVPDDACLTIAIPFQAPESYPYMRHTCSASSTTLAELVIST